VLDGLIRELRRSWLPERCSPSSSCEWRSLVMRLLRGVGMLVLAVMLASAWGCASTATKEGTGEYVDDSVITGKVKTAIYNDATLKVNEINVETFKGVVQLSGFVRSQADIDQAVQVARGVAGVKSVKNDMRLK
jgi:BON domain